jgi:hypothetical protein
VEINRIGNPFGNKSGWDEAHTFEFYKITKPWSDSGNTNATTLFNNWNTLAASFDPAIAGSASYTPGKRDQGFCQKPFHKLWADAV